MADGGIGGIAPGRVLGERYRLERVVATGGMASVWLARDQRLDRPVAVKVLSDVLAGDRGYLRRFRREARIAAGISHPNLVRVFDYGGRDERPYLVMEYVQGGTLADRIRPDGGAGVDAERLARELLEALRSIHTAGVVHRDVKPSNVLIGADGRARLTDFGIAQPEDATRLTQTGEVIGTLRYMAPEVTEGEPATERSDLYSAGVVLRECVGPPGAGALAALIARLTDRDPARRPRSASEALEALGPRAATPPTQRLRGTEPEAAGAAAGAPGAAAEPAGAREIHLDPARVLLGVAALAALVLLAILLLSGGDGDAGEGERAAPATQQTERRQPTETQPPAPAAGEPPPKAAAVPPPACGELESEKDRLEERQKAAEERLKEDKEAREAAKERFDAEKKALEEQLKACEEAEKEGEGDGGNGGDENGGDGNGGDGG